MAEVNYTKLKELISEKSELPNIYFLTGEPMLVSQCEKKLISHYLGEKYTDFDITAFNDENFSTQNLSTALETFPITTPKKCVLLRDLPWEEFTPESFDVFLEILSDIPPFSILIITQISLIVGNKNSSKLLKVKNFIKKHGISMNLSQKDLPLEKQLISWAKREYNKNLSSFNAKKILDMCRGYPIHELKSELKKICEFETSETITEKSLETVYKSTDKVSIFELPKALFSRNSKKCFEVLNKLFDQGEEAFGILSVLSAEYIDMYRVKVFEENPAEIANYFDYKGKEFRISIAVKRAKKLSIQNIAECLRLILESNLQLLTSSLDRKFIVSKLLVLLIQKNLV